MDMTTAGAVQPARDALAAPRRRLLRLIGVAFGAQFLWMAGFSAVEFHSGALTLDFSIFYQAAWQISHGHLDPVSTSQGYAFWRDHGEVLMWPLAPLSLLPPHGLWLLFAQDGATAAAGWVAVTLVADLTGQAGWPARLPPGLAVGTAALLLLANPWVYDAAGFDFHMQAFAVLASLLAARNLIGGRPARTAVYVALALAAGDVAGTYVVGVGLTGVLVARSEGRPVRPAVVVAGAGLAWTALLSLLHANLGSGLASAYGYLAGVAHPGLAAIAAGAVAHPGRVLDQLRLTGGDLYDTVLPVGLVGLASPWSPVAWITLLADGLHHGTQFARPIIHQPMPVWPFSAVGTVWGLGWLARRSRYGLLAVPIVVVTSLVSAATWLPRYPGNWL